MFKTNSVIRRRVMQHVEERLREAEEDYRNRHSALLVDHQNQIDDLLKGHEEEHRALLDGVVHKIISKIL